MIKLFNLLLYQPLLNLLVFLYNTIPGRDLGLAIIILTIIIRLILWPLSQKSLKSQKALQLLQPKLAALKETYKHDKAGLARETMSLYRQNKVNPFSSLLPILIQLPILIAVYRVFKAGFTASQLVLYHFIHNPGQLNSVSLGIIDLAKPYFLLALLTGIFQYWQTKMLPGQKPASQFVKKDGAKDENILTGLNKQMSIMMPIFTVIIGLTLPSGLMLYWLVGLILTIVQQFLMLKNR